MEGLAAYADHESSSSSNSSSSDEDGPRPTKRRRGAAAAPGLLGRSAVSAAFRARDDPSSNDGRVRQFGHAPGNWATFVCVPVDHSEALERWVAAVIEAADAHCARSAAAGSEPPQWRRVAAKPGGGSSTGGSSHVSLSRTFPLRYPEIVPFCGELDTAIRDYNSREATGAGSSASAGGGDGGTATGFSLTLRQLKFFTNEDKTRSFLSLCPAGGYSRGAPEQLVRLIRNVVDPACVAAGAPTFYEPAEPHLSVVWTIGDLTEVMATGASGSDGIVQLQADVEGRLGAAGSDASTEGRPNAGRSRSASDGRSSIGSRATSGSICGVVVRVDGIQSKSGDRLSWFPLT